MTHETARQRAQTTNRMICVDCGCDFGRRRRAVSRRCYDCHVASVVACSPQAPCRCCSHCLTSTYRQTAPVVYDATIYRAGQLAAARRAEVAMGDAR